MKRKYVKITARSIQDKVEIVVVGVKKVRAALVYCNKLSDELKKQVHQDKFCDEAVCHIFFED